MTKIWEDCITVAKSAPYYLANLLRSATEGSHTWTQIPCMPYDSGRWTASCMMTEGYDDNEHTHWYCEKTGVEFVNICVGGLRVAPNGYVRNG